jgi:hypothetical protein
VVFGESPEDENAYLTLGCGHVVRVNGPGYRQLTTWACDECEELAGRLLDQAWRLLADIVNDVRTVK